MKTSSKNGLTALVAGSALIGSLALAPIAFAAEPITPNQNHGTFQRPLVVGTVTSVSSNMLTVTVQGFGRGRMMHTTSNKPTTYTVNASGATVTKNGSISTVSAIAVGDRVMVQGTESGTTLTATVIRDGVPARPNDEKSIAAPNNMMATITGNGEPVIGGSITAVSGTTLTVTTKSGTAYTVNATSAKINKANATSTIESIAMGDSVIVQGTVNGTSVTASSVIDGGATPAATTVGTPAPVHRGFFGAIGGFFTRLFGFF